MLFNDTIVSCSRHMQAHAKIAQMRRDLVYKAHHVTFSCTNTLTLP